jgi:hypothetical protein
MADDTSTHRFISHSSFLARLPQLALLLTLAACGGGDGGAGPTSTSDGAATLTGTLAYVVSECREDAAGYFLHQSLLVRQGERAPIAVMEVPDIGPAPRGRGTCLFENAERTGVSFVAYGPVQHIAVSADGSAVVFELSDAFSLLGDNLLTPEQRGLFFIRADGTGLRQLGPPNRHASFIRGKTTVNRFDLVFSPDGRTLAFPDLGPGLNGEEAVQIFALDVATGTRTQLTHLPPVPPDVDVSNVAPGGLCCPLFVDDQTVAFRTLANPDGLNPHSEFITPIVNADGSGDLRLPPAVVALPGSQIDPRFVITGGQPTSVLLSLPGQPVNPDGSFPISELFFFDGSRNFLQLTNFHRTDTRTFGGDARQRVFVVASADPLGSNPSENCQIFSIASLGGDLRQLTQFRETDHSRTNCHGNSRRGLGCRVAPVGRDVNTGTLVFESSCDPFGTNPNGTQLFALGADGTGLRQLTDARGLVPRTGDGTTIAEFPYPFVYPGPAVE